MLSALQGQANIEVVNYRKQTPLLLAISQGHASLVELLVLKGECVCCALTAKRTILVQLMCFSQNHIHIYIGSSLFVIVNT